MKNNISVVSKFHGLHRKRRRLYLCALVLLCGLLGSGCTPIPPATQIDRGPSEIPETEAAFPPATEVGIPAAGLSPTAQVIFTIANDEPASGIAGAPVPDWRGWGAPAFTVAPDGSFWILDTAAAHPPRLLGFSPTGTLEIEIPLEGRVMGAVDVAAAEDVIWVFGIASQPAQVAAFDMDGRLLETFSLPESLFESEGVYVANMFDDLRLGAGGELLLKGPVEPGLYEFLDAGGELTARLLDTYAFAGHLYRIESPGLVYIDDRPVVIDPVFPEGRLVGADLLGVRPDGAFYVAALEERVQPGQAARYQRIVHTFSAAGEHLGLSLPPEGAVWVESNRDLALGPDGALYALVSRQDHSVDLLRLGFSADLAALPEPPPTPAVTPALLTPLLPAWVTPPAGATDLDIARNTLLSFFTYLHDGDYTEASALFGGRPEDVIGSDPGAVPVDPAAFWEQACFLLQCLQVADLVEEEQVAADEFRFLVEFMWDDGSLFVLGPCCGAGEADMPPVWRFPYSVKVVEGRFVVMEPPQYVP